MERPLTELEEYLLDYIGQYQPCPMPSPEQINLFIAVKKVFDKKELQTLLEYAIGAEEYRIAGTIRDKIKSMQSNAQNKQIYP